jgi:hypothetical protein
MTLATKIIILQPTPVEAVYNIVDAMVNDRGEPSIATREPGSIRNRIGQGNRSMLDITYAIDGPIDEQPDARREYEESRAKYPDDEDYGISDYYAPVSYCTKIDLDTGYGFQEEGIGGCSDLHAAIIMAVAAFAADYGSEIMWRNEFTGEWFSGLDGLDAFAGNAVSAMDWFQNTVKPLFASIGVVS